MLKNSIDLLEGNLKFCECGCKELIPTRDKRGRPITFKNHHHNKRSNHYNWKNGIITDVFGYERELRPEHPFADYSGRVKRHRLIYEEYYNCILLPYVDIDHINKIKNDNRIENLRPMYKSNHIRMHMIGNKHGKGNKGQKRIPRIYKRLDMSDRQCFDCLLYFTYTDRRGLHWYIYLNMFLCKKCYYHRNKWLLD